MSKRILVTGGAGYIGSHACLALVEAGHSVVVLDNLCNSSREAVRRVERITDHLLPFYRGDVRDRVLLEDILGEHRIDAVIHCAGLKAVGESVAQPLEYFDCNILGTLTLLRAMQTAGIRQFVFSSSATVYGNPESVPITETARLSATNPYGRSKLIVEQILEDVQKTDPDWCIGILRYFNPVGAHSSGLIGEDPRGVPSNLMPFIAQVACGRQERLLVYGNDYPTPDGTGVRDYIHVVDLARGHVAALERLFKVRESFTINLGTGQGYSVLEMVKAFEAACGNQIPYRVVDQRPGDIAVCYADTAKAHALLGWRAEKNLQAMCADQWRWQSQNPNGFELD